MRTQLLALILCASSVARAQDLSRQFDGSDVSLRAYGERWLMNSILVADSMETNTAERIAKRTQNAAVRAFASTIALDHRTHFDLMQPLSKDDQVGRAGYPPDSTFRRALRVEERLDAMKDGPSLDRAFVREEILGHEYLLSLLRSKRAAAYDEEFVRGIDTMMSTCQRHLNQARALQSHLK